MNSSFRFTCESKHLKGRNVTAARNPAESPPPDQDLFIRFSKVKVDYDNLYLVLGIEFIDPRTNAVLGTIPVREYYKGIFWTPWGFERYLYNDLDEVALKLQVEVTGKPKS